MGRDLHYREGDFYRVDDRTGFPTRAGRTRKQWNNIFVDERFYESRQPQDLVRGRPDIQRVPEPRPIAPNTFVGSMYDALAAAAAPADTRVYAQNPGLFSAGMQIGIMLDDGIMFRTTVTHTGASTFGDAIFGVDVFGGDNSISLADALPYSASSGNVVVIYEPSPALPP